MTPVGAALLLLGGLIIWRTARAHKRYRAGPWPGLSPAGAVVLLGCALLLGGGQLVLGDLRTPWPDLPLHAVLALAPMALATRLVRAPGAASAVCGAYLLPRALLSLVDPSIEPPPLLLVPALAFDITAWLRPSDLANVGSLWPGRTPPWRRRARGPRSLDSMRSGATSDRAPSGVTRGGVTGGGVVVGAPGGSGETRGAATSAATGAATGGVTGGVTGAATGGVTGGVTGAATGGVTGAVTGAATGGVTGAVTRPFYAGGRRRGLVGPRRVGWGRGGVAGAIFGGVLAGIEPAFAVLLGGDPAVWSGTSLGLASGVTALGCAIVGLAAANRRDTAGR